MGEVTYTTRIIKGGALLADMRLLAAFWDGSEDCAERAITTGPLSHLSRKRAEDILRSAFLPRFVRSDPPDLWRPLQVLEAAGWPSELIRPLHYYAAAAAEPLLAEVVRQLFEPRYALGQLEIAVQDVVRFLASCPERRFAGGRWSDDTSRRVAQGVLSSLRDFAVLKGAVNKRLAPLLLPVPTFALLSMVRHAAGKRGLALLRDPAWQLFYLSESSTEKLFVEAQQRSLLQYHAAGSIIRVDYPDRSLEDYARTLTQRAN